MPLRARLAAVAVTLAVAVASLASAAPLDAVPQQEPVAERIAGLLTLPEVFGGQPCEAFAPGEIPLYTAPDSRRAIGSIRVDRGWTLPECSGLLVNVHRESRAVTRLPTREHDYEAPAAIVLERRGDWYRVQLDDGSAWLPHVSQPAVQYVFRSFSESVTTCGSGSA
jgi:hypothetical protein